MTNNKSRILITGAGGFAGHHFLEHILVNTDWDIVCTDSFKHKGKTDRISEVLDSVIYPMVLPPDGGEANPWKRRVKVITHDLTVPFSEQAIDRMGQIDYIVAYASESHVDRSIIDPVSFTRNNVDVVLNTLELARKVKPRSLVWISTDEVYGPVKADDLRGHREWDTIMPSNPYSGSKAAQEAIAFSYWRTYGVPLVLVNCMNMIGERQDPEKFVPLVLGKVLRDEEVVIHGTPDNMGTRHYLHSRNLADGILFVLNNTVPTAFGSEFRSDRRCGDKPDRFNIANHDRVENLAMAKMIAQYAGKELKYRLEDFHSTRPGHDPHYGLDTTLMEQLGWQQPFSLETSLKHTIEWTMRHPEWLLP